MNLKEMNEALLSSKVPLTARIFKDYENMLMAIGLNTGMKLKEHKAPGRAKIIVLEGEINYKSQTTNRSITQFETFDIPLGEVHSVVANLPSIFLLLIA